MRWFVGARHLGRALPIWLVAVAGCGGGDRPSEPELVVEGAWARATTVSGLPGQTGNVNSAVYLVLRNEGGVPDRFLGGMTPVAASLELHQSMEEAGVMRMQALEGIDVPAGGQVELRPGGVHIMLLGLEASLMEGDTVEMTLRFQRSGTLSVRVPVRSVGPT